MIYRTVIAVCLISLSSLCEAQAKPPKPTLQETISWMANFSQQHGFFALGSAPLRVTFNTIVEVKGCNVDLDVRLPTKATENNRIKRSITHIDLADLDPTKVRAEKDADDGPFYVNFETSDAKHSSEGELEFGTGGKLKMWSAQESMVFDTEDAALRFARALSHAITLCGGTRAPF